jgi:hypothetical protein
MQKKKTSFTMKKIEAVSIENSDQFLSPNLSKNADAR